MEIMKTMYSYIFYTRKQVIPWTWKRCGFDPIYGVINLTGLVGLGLRYLEFICVGWVAIL